MLFSTFRALVALKWRERWNDWWQSTVIPSLHWLFFFFHLSSEFIIKGKKTHAPDCMPPLMGNSFSTVSSGKPVYFLFSRRVVNSTFFGSRSVSLLKGFVLQLLWNGYAADQCVWLKERRGPCGKRNPGARKSHSLFFLGGKHNGCTRWCQSSKGIWLYTPPQLNSEFQTGKQGSHGGAFSNPRFQSEIKMFRWKVLQEDFLWCKATLFSWATTQ